MLRRSIVVREQPGGVNAVNGAVEGVCSPWSPLCAQQSDLTARAAQAPPQTLIGAEYLSPSHVWNEPFNSLHTPFPGNCQEESINGSEVFAEHVLGLCKPFRVAVRRQHGPCS